MSKNRLTPEQAILIEAIEQMDDGQIAYIKDVLDRERQRLNLELAKVRVAMDAMERDCPEEVPPSIKVWLDKKEAELKNALPIG